MTSGDIKPGGLTVAGLFAGIGGIEVGLRDAGHRTTFLCDVDEAAQRVLAERFPGVPIVGDVGEIVALPEVDMIAGGFPCQDLSQAGLTAGIQGRQSSLVNEVLRLVEHSSAKWLLLENVPFMLQLARGEAMRFVTHSLEQLGFSWAYRVVDARAFGLPQRRHRVLLLASRTEDPREVLFVGDEGEPTAPTNPSELACGFYWTEGTRGLGWAVDAVPTLKGGSSIGIPSPPAIWFPDGFVGVPDLRDAERLQGFDADWTSPAAPAGTRQGARWKLVGNAVSVPVAGWVGARLNDPQPYDGSGDKVVQAGTPWPKAAWGSDGQVRRAELSAWPVRVERVHLHAFLEHAAAPLSERAAAGFLKRANGSRLNFPEGLLPAVEAHLDAVRGALAA